MWYLGVIVLAAHTLSSRRVSPRRRTCGIELSVMMCQQRDQLLLMVVGPAVLTRLADVRPRLRLGHVVRS